MKTEPQKDRIEEAIINHEIFGMPCVPLKDFYYNLTYCPYRAECKELEETISSINEMESLIREPYCQNCISTDWIFIGITKQGTFTSLIMKEAQAKKINTILRPSQP